MTTPGKDWVGEVVLGRYRIVRPLAEGGMGIVYLGRVEGAAGFARPVVVKTVIPRLSQDAEVAGMFVREARILSNLQHPGIVGVMDFGEVKGAHVMVLEYVHGFHLGQWMRYLGFCRRRMDLDYALFIAAHVLDALHYAHQLKRPDGTLLGIVHRDVSPANVLIDLEGRIKLHDFGIARMAEENAEYKTEIGTFKGTYHFAAPETFQGQPATPQSDLYSCALVLHQMLTGANPQKGTSSKETLYRVLNEIPPLVSTQRPGVPEVVDAAVARALKKDPAERFPSAGAFAEALRAGRQRPEEEVAEDFAKLIAFDFQGNMPDLLGVESLGIRDRAWRAVQEGPAESRLPLRSSIPPMRGSEPSPEAAAAPTVIARPMPKSAAEASAASAQPKRLRTAVLIGLLGLTVAGLGSAATYLTTRRSPVAPWPSFVVIEKQRVDEQPGGAAWASPVDPSTSAETVRPSASDTPAPSTSETPARATGSTPAGKSSPGGFSRAFQRQQPGVERCFARYATDVEGQPTIMVRFSIDTKGSVQRADLTPSALGGTPLGQCLLAEARAAHFDPQPEPVTFTIPVTARRTR
jgi:serine/threonine-protein kinase